MCNIRIQQPSESIASFIVHAMVMHCKFGDMLEDMIQDQTLCEFSDSRIFNASYSSNQM